MADPSPDALLLELRELAADVLDPDVEIRSGIEAAEELAGGFLALDRLLRNGAAPPSEWTD